MSPPELDIQLLPGPVAPVGGDRFGAEVGAECLFFGRTRRDVHPEHGALVRLTYHAYEPMARRELERLAADAAARHGCRMIRLHHALGDVPPGEASVLVQVTCGHRAEAFAACRFLIDELKRRVPIWKREEWSDGSSWSTGTPVAAAAHDGARS